VLEHGIVCLLTRLLAHLGVRPDASADDVLESDNNALSDGRRPNDYAANQTFVVGDVVAFDAECGCDEHKCDDVRAPDYPTDQLFVS
jgi:hypothetical protein